MSIRLTDPSGESWIVTQHWLGLPGWSRKKIDPESTIDSLKLFSDLAILDTCGGQLLVVGVLVAFAIVSLLLLPLLFLLGGAAVAAVDGAPPLSCVLEG